MTNSIQNFSPSQLRLETQSASSLSPSTATQIQKENEIRRVAGVFGKVIMPLFAQLHLFGMIASYLGNPLYRGSLREDHTLKEEVLEFMKICSPEMIEAWLMHLDHEDKEIRLSSRSLRYFDRMAEIILEKGKKIFFPSLWKFQVYNDAKPENEDPNALTDFNNNYQRVINRLNDAFDLPGIKNLFYCGNQSSPNVLDPNQHDTEAFLQPFAQQSKRVTNVTLNIQEPRLVSFAAVKNFSLLTDFTLQYDRTYQSFDLTPLSHCQQLKRLNISETKSRSTPSPRFDFSFLRTHRSLSYLFLNLNFSGEPSAEEIGLALNNQPIIPRGAASIETLVFVCENGIMDSNIVDLFLPNLTELDLGKCHRISDLAISKFDENFPKLTSVQLDETGITDRSIVYLATHPNLQYAAVGMCPNLSVNTLSYLDKRRDFFLIRGEDQFRVRQAREAEENKSEETDET